MRRDRLFHLRERLLARQRDRRQAWQFACEAWCRQHRLSSETASEIEALVDQVVAEHRVEQRRRVLRRRQDAAIKLPRHEEPNAELRVLAARFARLDTLKRRRVGHNAALAEVLHIEERDLSPAERRAARRYALSFVAVWDRRGRPPSALEPFVARLVQAIHHHTGRRVGVSRAALETRRGRRRGGPGGPGLRLVQAAVDLAQLHRHIGWQRRPSPETLARLIRVAHPQVDG